jgi:hypothetical protein
MCFDQFGEGAGAVTDPVLLHWLELPESVGATKWDEHRVVAEAPVAAGRPSEGTRYLTAEQLGLATGPSEGKNRDE